MVKQKITIIGMGRFGQVWVRLLRDDFEITVFSRNQTRLMANAPSGVVVAKTLAQALRNQVVFYCVPIGKFESVIKTHSRFLTKEHLVIDTLSVKTHPAKILRNLNQVTGARAILTHPMFGPDSAKDGFTGLPIVMSNLNATLREFAFWRKLFADKGLKVIQMSPEEHDRLAANSQGLTHFVGRLLEKMKLVPTEIDTQGAKKLHEVMEQTCNDTIELFRDLQQHNPHTMLMREKLIRASKNIIGELLPSHVESGVVTIGIQGGQGSFNELAANEFVIKQKIRKVNIKPLFTTRKVLTELNRGQVDLGVFAIANSRGGLVDESLVEIGRFEFKIVDRIVLPVQHFLMKRPDTAIDKIRSIMAHDQVFKQCVQNLSNKHPKLKLVEGRGDMKDTARAAQALVEGKLPKTTAILGNARLAEIFGLEIIDKNLEDDPNNRTTFLIVRRV